MQRGQPASPRKTPAGIPRALDDPRMFIMEDTLENTKHPSGREAAMSERRVTTVGRLLTKLRADDPAVFDRLALFAAIPADRLERASRDERCLRSMEQLRLAEWLIRNAPAYRRAAHTLRSQVVAADRMSAGETACHPVAPVVWR